MTGIVIADDHELIREGIKKIIRSSKGIHIAGEAADIEQTLRLAAAHEPDIIVLDINLPGIDGLEGLELVRQQFPAIPVLILSMYPEERYAVRALKAGASGYITKSMAAEELPKAIQKIIDGGVYVSPQLAELLANEARHPSRMLPHECLTERELQVVSMLASGMQVKQIAARLAISISSVNTYRTRIFRKTGMVSNAALIRYAIEHQLVS
ncbi:LuxR family two component transcriptional regulator [Paucimonas lemoignei]|uniref:LuxR family two component transcriptional regulator n=1 Tax=Paucimonas lemoignei TaxID=29443 RepID=A0A4R3I179_PAULE|nr:response regulator transcription factor [Paucimonas lemoignei]TCS38451.1 LuxR family two component transcriptional regulator [Paucimonas lemoignei]